MRPLKPEDVNVSRFWEKVDIGGDEDCWPFTGARTPEGYGKFRVGKYMPNASRVAYVVTNGDIGELIVCHKCDNPPCCNPKHLFAGTHKDNQRDKWRKGRAAPLGGAVVFGEDVGNSKLTRQAVEEIRRLYAAGEMDQPRLTKRFGVSQTTISRVVLRQTWK
jgi:hypothetical protein